jgi:two-component system, NarL family, response regulator DegU
MKKLNILIAEDEDANRYGLNYMLEKEALCSHIYFAANGREALDIVAQHPVDAVLLDITMPVMCGRETAEELIKHFPHIKIVVITNHKGPAMLITLLKMGVHSVVYKHHGFGEMVKAVKQVCSTRGALTFPKTLCSLSTKTPTVGMALT